MRDLSCSLLDVPAGCRARVVALSAAPAMRSRLYALGFLPGTEVEVCTDCGGPGSRRVRIRDACLVLGENMAEHISCIIPGGGRRSGSLFHGRAGAGGLHSCDHYGARHVCAMDCESRRAASSRPEQQKDGERE